jgi:hypothetical protein
VLLRDAFESRTFLIRMILDHAIMSGCIVSAKLWYEEIAGTLKSNGFTANLRDTCIFNKNILRKQFMIIVYVDDLKMTCVDKSAALEMERIL